MTVVCDVREPEDYQKLADKTDDLRIDYIVIGERRRYAIERKTVFDLIHSVRDARLWDQLKVLTVLKEEGYIPILALEGYVWSFFKNKSLTLAQWLGVQLAVASFGVPIVQVSGKKQLGFLLRMLDEKAGQVKEYVRPTIPKPKDRSIRDERVDMLAAVNGIGIKTAESLVERFGSIRGVVEADVGVVIEMIGDKKARHLMEVLG